MVSRSQIQSYILGTSLIMAFTCGHIYDYYQRNKPEPEIPVQSWDKFVRQQNSLGKDI